MSWDLPQPENGNIKGQKNQREKLPCAGGSEEGTVDHQTEITAEMVAETWCRVGILQNFIDEKIH
jgi:hypothetical protein